MSEDVTKCVICSVAFICITFLAAFFQRAGILWWYVVPTLIAVD